MTEINKILPLIFVAAGFAFVGILVYISLLRPVEGKLSNNKSNSSFYIVTILILAFLTRIIASFINYGYEHGTDMTDFSIWADMLFNNGISAFYSSDGLTDYPPGYMYILWFFGMVRHLTGLDNSIFFTILKLPAILCDIGIAFIIYRLAEKNFSNKASVIVASFFAFNPAAITNCALWGQVDSVYTLLLLAMLYFIYEKKHIPAYFLFAASILVKLQSFMLAPILFFSVIEDFFIHDFDKKKILKNLACGLIAIISMFIISIPFGIGGVIAQYIETLSSYPYMTVNAFNIWNFMGQNWVGTDSLNDMWSILGISGTMPDFASALGWALIVVITVICGIVFFRAKKRSKIFVLGAFLFLSSYMFSVKMHERYSFPALALLLAVYCTIPCKRSMLTYISNSLFQFVAYAWILYVYETDINTYAFCTTQRVLSAMNIILYISFAITLFKLLKPSLDIKTKLINNDERKYWITKNDKKYIVAITTLYAVIALTGLGSFSAPQTVYTLTPEAPIDVTFEKTSELSRVAVYLGAEHTTEANPLIIDFYDEAGNNIYSEKHTDSNVFFWNYYDTEITAKSACISSTDKLYIMNITFLDENNNIIMPINSNNYNAVFDETNLTPDSSDFMNSTYFDEIYHARTAYEFIHGLPVYEWTHPPLGKIFISLGILIFGMCPFGWRIAGTLFGIAMVPVIYVFAKKITGRNWIALGGCVLYTFDFMHFTQTRIATIDVYVTFFIILMYLYMYKFYISDFYSKTLREVLKPLALSGLFFGLGAASKWTAFYACAGLAVIWLITMISNTIVFLKARKAPQSCTGDTSNAFIMKEYIPRLIKTVLWCCIFFIVVPTVIYILSYIPYLRCSGDFSPGIIYSNQLSMYTYHAETVVGSEHPYSSHWYEWLIMKRPIWYYAHDYSDSVKGGISAFGNPLVWWTGLAAVLFNSYMLIAKKDKKALFLIIGYFAQLVPWIPITRTTYIYHYFPAVLFLVLMICNSVLYIYTYSNDKTAVKKSFGIYTIFAVILFVMFYPVLSGIPVYENYVDVFLKWFSSWVLI